jgi:hypothetical protein
MKQRYSMKRKASMLANFANCQETKKRSSIHFIFMFNLADEQDGGMQKKPAARTKRKSMPAPKYADEEAVAKKIKYEPRIPAPGLEAHEEGVGNLGNYAQVVVIVEAPFVTAAPILGE